MNPPRKRILIADDSAVVRHTIVRKLAPANADVVVAETAQEADAIDATTLDVAVLDLEFGTADGTETADRIRAQNATVRIAFFTSGSSPERIARAQAIGPVFS